MQHSNRICALLGLRYPIVQGGMVHCSGSALVAAVSGTGALGVLGAGSMYAERLAEEIEAVRRQTTAPFGVNVPLLYAHAEACLRVCIAARVPVVITSAGSPAKWTADLHRAGIVVGHVVANRKFTQKAEAAGVDFLVAEGFEAGGHNGVEALSTLVLTQLVRQWTDLPYLSAGGYCDGHGLCAALALGADGIQVGSRFACTVESSAHEATKRAYLEARSRGTAILMRTVQPTRVLRNAFAEQMLDMAQRGVPIQEQLDYLGKGRARRGIAEGDLEQGELEIGQIAAAFHDLPRAADVVAQMVAEYEESRSWLEAPRARGAREGRAC